MEDYLVPMWRRVFAAFGRTAADTGAIRIAKLIVEKALKEIKVRDVLQKDWQGLKTQEDVTSAFDTLIENDWLGEPSKLSKGGSRGGRKTLVYPVNPKVFEKSIHNGESK